MHNLIIGRTLSGKTTLAKKLAKEYTEQGVLVLVLDPMQDPEWTCDYITDDREAFLKTAFANQAAQLFIDESGETVGRYGGEMNKLATKGRHWGHVCNFIGQRLVQIDPNARTQCSNLFLFQSGPKDAQTLHDEFVDTMILDAPSLQQGECIAKIGLEPAFRLTVF